MRNNLHKGFQFYRLHLQLTNFSKNRNFRTFCIIYTGYYIYSLG